MHGPHARSQTRHIGNGFHVIGNVVPLLLLPLLLVACNTAGKAVPDPAVWQGLDEMDEDREDRSSFVQYLNLISKKYRDQKILWLHDRIYTRQGNLDARYALAYARQMAVDENWDRAVTNYILGVLMRSIDNRWCRYRAASPLSSYSLSIADVPIGAYLERLTQAAAADLMLEALELEHRHKSRGVPVGLCATAEEASAAGALPATDDESELSRSASPFVDRARWQEARMAVRGGYTVLAMKMKAAGDKAASEVIGKRPTEDSPKWPQSAGDLVAALDELEATRMRQELIDRLLAPRNGTERDVIMSWLRERLQAAEGVKDARYPYVYGGYLYRQGDVEGAALYYSLGRLMVKVDSLWCADKSARSVEPWKVIQWARPVAEYLSELDEAEARSYMHRAIEVEGKYSEREPAFWICARGMEYWTAFMKAHPAVGEMETPPNARVNLRIEEFVGENPTLVPEFVPRETWLADRAEFRDGIR